MVFLCCDDLPMIKFNICNLSQLSHDKLTHRIDEIKLNEEELCLIGNFNAKYKYMDWSTILQRKLLTPNSLRTASQFKNSRCNNWLVSCLFCKAKESLVQFRRKFSKTTPTSGWILLQLLCCPSDSRSSRWFTLTCRSDWLESEGPLLYCPFKTSLVLWFILNYQTDRLSL